MSETTKRILSSIVLVAFFLVAFLYPGFYYLDLLVFGLGIVFLGLREFYDFSHREESQVFRGIGYFFSFAITIVFFTQFIGIQQRIIPPDWALEISKMVSNPSFSVVTMLFTALMISAFLLQIIKRPLDGAMMSVATTVLATLYMAFPIGHFFLMLGLPYGEYYIFLVCVITFMSDTGAYFGGRWFGKNPAGLKVSPKKTWEGYVMGNLTAVVMAQVLNFGWVYFTGQEIPMGILETVILSIVISFISVVGDLAESALKRDAKIKDSASLIPGHGGMLDLADALLFTLPALYYYLKIKEMIGFEV
ncbi:MAG: CDP-archaeol synthase [Leptospira sp.]|nr:CDP-archaeol synthase [Leptospira sp.]